MIEISCLNCSKALKISSLSEMPAECPGCFKVWPANVRIMQNESNRLISSITFVHQPYGDKFEIKASDSILIGRNHHGAKLLSSIMNENGSPVISRLHCEIFFIEGQVLITDRNSKNGTFIGENKAPCIGLKRSLQNEDILFLGQERFLVLFSYEAREPNPGESNGNKLYRCNDITCGAETSDYNEKCPSCNAMRTLQVVV